MNSDVLIVTNETIGVKIKKCDVKYYSDILGFEIESGFVVGVPVDLVHEKFSGHVEVQCPHCLETRETQLKTVRAAGHTYCQRCSAHGTYGHMVGERYGRLLVLRINDERRLSGKVMVATCSCLCECGEHFEASCVDLLRGNTQSCGCLQKDSMKGKGRNVKVWSLPPSHITPVYKRNSVFDELVGTKISKLNILYYGDGHKTKGGNFFPTFICQCECGKFVESICHAIKSGNTTSCNSGKCHHKHKSI